MTSGMQQLFQLCKKNFIVKVRNKRASLAEFFFVLYFLGIVVLVVKLNSKQLSSYPSLPVLPQSGPVPLGLDLGTDRQARNLTYLYYLSPPQSRQPPDWYNVYRKFLHVSFCQLMVMPHVQVCPLNEMSVPDSVPRGLCLRSKHCAIYSHRDVCHGKFAGKLSKSDTLASRLLVKR
jgi:hypothetical protein